MMKINKLNSQIALIKMIGETRVLERYRISQYHRNQNNRKMSVQMTSEQGASLGSYRGYYKRNQTLDEKLALFKVTTRIAKEFRPMNILGVDIDKVLIDGANSRLKRANFEEKRSLIASLEVKKKTTPWSSTSSFVPRNIVLKKAVANPSGAVTLKSVLPGIYPKNVDFACANILEFSETAVRFDTVLCLSLSKWIHLNFGDKGLLDMFQKLCRLLRKGGRLILEYQPWKSYLNNKAASENIKATFPGLKLRPHNFEAILTKEFGFVVEERLGPSVQEAHGFNRPILVLRKPLHGSEILDECPSVDRYLDIISKYEKIIDVSSILVEADATHEAKAIPSSSCSITSSECTDHIDSREGKKQKKKRKERECTEGISNVINGDGVSKKKHKKHKRSKADDGSSTSK